MSDRRAIPGQVCYLRIRYLGTMSGAGFHGEPKEAVHVVHQDGKPADGTIHYVEGAGLVTVGQILSTLAGGRA